MVFFQDVGLCNPHIWAWERDRARGRNAQVNVASSMVCKFAIYSKSKTVSTACGQIAYSISPQTPSLPGRQPAEARCQGSRNRWSSCSLWYYICVENTAYNRLADSTYTGTWWEWCSLTLSAVPGREFSYFLPVLSFQNFFAFIRFSIYLAILYAVAVYLPEIVLRI